MRLALVACLLALAGCGPTTSTPSTGASPTAKPSTAASASTAPAASPSAAAASLENKAVPATISLKVDGADTKVEQTAAYFTAFSTQGLFWDTGKGAGAGQTQTQRGAALGPNEATLTFQLRNQPEPDFIYHFHDFAIDKLQYAITVVMIRNTGTRSYIWGHQADHRPTEGSLTVVDGKVNLALKIKLDADKRQNDETSPALDIDIKGLPIPVQK